MSKAVLRLVASYIALVGCVLMGPASAQQKHPFGPTEPPTSSRYVQRYAIDVNDLPDHQIVVSEIQRVHSENHPTVMGVKVVETWSYIFTDRVGNVGRNQGYSVWMLEDGNKVYSEQHGTIQSEARSGGSQKGVYHGVTKFVGGTGKFANLRGVLTDELEYDTDPKTGYNRPVSRGEYWFGN